MKCYKLLVALLITAVVVTGWLMEKIPVDSVDAMYCVIAHVVMLMSWFWFFEECKK